MRSPPTFLRSGSRNLPSGTARRRRCGGSGGAAGWGARARSDFRPVTCRAIRFIAQQPGPDALRQMFHPPIDAGSQRKAVPPRGKEHAQQQSQHHQEQIHLNVPQPHQQQSRISNQFAAGRWRKSPPGDQRAKSSTDRINVPTSHSPAALPNSAGRVYQAQSQYHE